MKRFRDGSLKQKANAPLIDKAYNFKKGTRKPSVL